MTPDKPTNIDGVIPIIPEPPLPPVVVGPVIQPIPLKDHVWDVTIRTAKTFVAVYAAFVTAGGLDVLHIGSATEIKITSIAAVLTAMWNAVIKVYQQSQ